MRASWLASTSLAACYKFGVGMASIQRSRRMLTERRTPTPAKITFAGENTCEIWYDKGWE
jgi:hypothetical protein